MRNSLGAVAATAVGLPCKASSAASNRPRRQVDRPTVTVTTKSGDVRGLVLGDLNVFRGIPFASPPVGDLRFKAPVPAAPWTSARDAFRMGASPVQGDANHMNPADSEDCLFLNVSAPAAPGSYPVYVWIYGGGNSSGSSTEPTFGGSLIAHSGVVVVTMNYRVGAFGFLDLGSVLGEEYNGSANNGILDQAIALRWVHDNIAAFGGDPARVTVGGESAGAKNVCALLVLPAAAGLFRSAVMESGSGQTVSTREEAAGYADLFLEGLQLDRATAKTLLSASTKDILAAEQYITAKSPRNFPFRPVVDGRILPKRPVDGIAAGMSKNVTLLIGTNHDESRTFLSDAQIAGPITHFQVSNADVAAVQKVDAAYSEAFPTMSPADRRIQLITAEEYWAPSIRVAQAHSENGGATYMYRFDYPEQSGSHRGYSVHGFETGFVFARPVNAHGDLTARQTLTKCMQELWLSFIKDQKPASALAPAWPLYDAKTRSTLILNETSKIEADPAGEQRRLWDGVI